MVDLCAESAADTTHSGQRARTADGRLTTEVEPGSAFRLAWLRMEGWRAQLRKGGDLVERARRESKMEDSMAASASRARRTTVSEAVQAHVPTLTIGGSVEIVRNRNTAPRAPRDSGKRVRWFDRLVRK